MWEFIGNNKFLCGAALYLIVKFIVRITPTKRDDDIFAPIENFILNYWLKIPNRKKGGGTH